MVVVSCNGIWLCLAVWSHDPSESPAKFQIISVYTKITTADFKTKILIINEVVSDNIHPSLSFRGKFKETLRLT